jgi:hypothetical protein
MAKVTQNTLKARVRELINLLPKRYGYATKIVERLERKGVAVKLSTVYQVAAGNMQDEDILSELILLVDDYKRKQQELESKMEEALNQYAACSV